MVAKSTTSDSIAIPWVTKNIKFQYGKTPLYFEELTEPWDLWVEGSIMNTKLGGPFHQVLVKSGLERIFSVRTPDRIPLCNIITMPINARKLSPYWCNRRILRTSNPMTIDGQQLIVLDAVQHGEKRARPPFLDIIKKFFIAHGGMLGDEHPNEIAISDQDDIKIWEKIVKNYLLENLLISSKEIAGTQEYATRVINLEEAIILLRARNWWRVILNGEEDWAEKVIEHLERDNYDRPHSSLDILGKGKKVRKLESRAKKIMEPRMSILL